MSESTLPPGAENSKPCRVCGELIKKTARVCIHCNNYQDWRANISFGNTFLALLVALISVLTTAIPVIVGLFTTKNSHLEFSFQGATEDSISVLISNLGSRPGSVGSFIFLTIPPKGAVVPLTFVGAKQTAAFLIEPGKSKMLQLTYDKGNKLTSYFTWKEVMDLAYNVPCTINIFATDFQARSGAAPLQPACKDIKLFLTAVARVLSSPTPTSPPSLPSAPPTP
jgi:hypothetical protein